MPRGAHTTVAYHHERAAKYRMTGPSSRSSISTLEGFRSFFTYLFNVACFFSSSACAAKSFAIIERGVP